MRALHDFCSRWSSLALICRLLPPKAYFFLYVFCLTLACVVFVWISAIQVRRSRDWSHRRLLRY